MSPILPWSVNPSAPPLQASRTDSQPPPHVGFLHLAPNPQYPPTATLPLPTTVPPGTRTGAPALRRTQRGTVSTTTKTTSSITSLRPTSKARFRATLTPIPPGLPVTPPHLRVSHTPDACRTATVPPHPLRTTTPPPTRDPTSLPIPEGPGRASMNPTVRLMRMIGASLWEEGSEGGGPGRDHTGPHAVTGMDCRRTDSRCGGRLKANRKKDSELSRETLGSILNVHGEIKA